MLTGTKVMKGVIHGRAIELENVPEMGDGQRVSVVLRPVTPIGEGLRKAFGSWREDAERLEAFISKVDADRADDRGIP